MAFKLRMSATISASDTHGQMMMQASVPRRPWPVVAQMQGPLSSSQRGARSMSAHESQATPPCFVSATAEPRAHDQAVAAAAKARRRMVRRVEAGERRTASDVRGRRRGGQLDVLVRDGQRGRRLALLAAERRHLEVAHLWAGGRASGQALTALLAVERRARGATRSLRILASR